jgi:hypothetical protein
MLLNRKKFCLKRIFPLIPSYFVQTTFAGLVPICSNVLKPYNNAMILVAVWPYAVMTFLSNMPCMGFLREL